MDMLKLFPQLWNIYQTSTVHQQKGTGRPGIYTKHRPEG